MEAAGIARRHRKCASPQAEASAHRAPQAVATVRPVVNLAAPRVVARAVTPEVAVTTEVAATTVVEAAEGITANEEFLPIGSGPHSAWGRAHFFEWLNPTN